MGRGGGCRLRNGILRWWWGRIAQQGGQQWVGCAGCWGVAMKDVPEFAMTFVLLPGRLGIRVPPEGGSAGEHVESAVSTPLKSTLQAIAQVPGFAPHRDDWGVLGGKEQEDGIQDAVLRGGQRDVDDGFCIRCPRGIGIGVPPEGGSWVPKHVWGLLAIEGVL